MASRVVYRRSSWAKDDGSIPTIDKSKRTGSVEKSNPRSVEKSTRTGSVEPGKMSQAAPGRKRKVSAAPASKAAPSYGRGSPQPSKVVQKEEPQATSKRIQKTKEDSFQQASRQNRSDAYLQKKIGLKGRGK